MPEDWLADVVKYEPGADPAVVKGIVRYCGIALQKRDSSMVSFSDARETDRVRTNFLKKKLALTDPDDVLDRAIAAVGGRMKADRTKNRVTVYYLLADHFGKLDVFGRVSKATATRATIGAAVASSGGTGPADDLTGVESGGTLGETEPPARPRSARAAAAPKIVSRDDAGFDGKAPGASVAADATDTGGAVRFADASDERPAGGVGWLFWALLALIFILFFLALRSVPHRPAVVTTAGGGGMTAVTADSAGAPRGRGQAVA